KEVSDVLKTKKAAGVLREALDNTEAVQLLIKEGMSPLWISRDLPVLHLAAEYRDCSAETFKLLCSQLQGNEVDLQNKRGGIALGCAIESESPEKVKLLLDKGADPDLIYVQGHG